MENIEFLAKELKREGGTVLDNIEAFDYGKFVHIVDTEGNKIALWQPKDMVYEKMRIDMGVKP